jgi:tyrosyl-tRNA synthetase
MDLFGEFEWRGLLYDATDGLRDVLARERVTGYIGFDPTAASLHVGSLLVIMALARMQRFGHSPIAIVGGGTGLIGDPSGKSAERTLLTTEQVEANVEGLRRQLSRFLDFDAPSNPARIVNNAEWLTKMSAIELMRDVGKYFTVNYMLAKESVKRRLGSDEGISYTEFSYLLLQSYDFVMLYDRFKCTLQMGGSDQWGNITAGVDLTRKLRGARVHGLVMPLVTTASGTKFGKTEAGTVWLDPELTRPYEFYQFWMKTDDRDAVRYLKFFTFLPQERIAELEASTERAPEKREAQRELAREVTRLVHGDEAVREAEANTSIVFATSVSVDDLRRAPEKLRLQRSLFASGVPLTHVLVQAGLAASNSEGARLIRGGGISLNGERLTDDRLVLTLSTAAVADGIFRIDRGRKQRIVVEVTDEVSAGVDSVAGEP